MAELILKPSIPRLQRLSHLPQAVKEAKRIEVSLSLVGQTRIRSLNKKWRKKDKATDVLSFPQQPFHWTPKGFQGGVLGGLPILSLGDVVISVDQAEIQAKEAGKSLNWELKRLFIHGLFHLLGFDHERSPEEEKVQFELEARFLEEEDS